MGRLSDLEELSREKLNLRGDVVLVPVPRPQLAAQGLVANPAATFTTGDLSKHTIKYAADVRLDDQVFFHEFCRAKLNEAGFRKVEVSIEAKTNACCSSEAEASQLRISTVVVVETLVDAILYRFFRAESEEVRSQLDYSFLMVGNLRDLERRFGFSAIAQAAGFRISKMQAGLGDNGALGKAVHEAFGGEKGTGEDYERVFSALSKLPHLGGPEGVKELTEEDVKTVVDCILDIYEIQSGKRCR